MNPLHGNSALVIYLSTLFALSACGGGGGGGDETTDASALYASAARTSVLLAGDTVCPNGGILVETGIDENANGVLDNSEVDSAEKVCNGLDGSTGSVGVNGADGSDGLNALVMQTNEPAGTNCTAGGVRFDIGIDANSNTILDVNEITSTEFVCAGLNAIDGTDGLNSLITQTNEMAGANCTYGGTKVDSGLDSNQNNILDAAEISATTYLCRAAADVSANGFAVTDAWGEVWDGLPRPLSTYADAETTCSSMGARLPTATELYRNNLLTGLSKASISTSTATEYLWTLIPTATVDTQVTVRLSDGASLSATTDSTQYFRCVWPDTASAGFDNNACNGKPGSECWSMDYAENVDSYDRLELDYVGASAECAFSNASIPVLSDWENLIHAGLPNATDLWLWSANAMYWYSNGYGNSLVRWSDTDNTRWSYTNSGGVSTVTVARHFRCIGNATPDQLVSETSPACNGDCFTSSAHGSILQIDSQDRSEATHVDAVAACQAIGAELPNQSEISDLIHAGLPNGSNLWLWISDPLYWYNGGYGNALVKWTDTGSPLWAYSNVDAQRASTTGSFAYRCVWRQKINDLPSCLGTSAINRSFNHYQCVNSTDGDSAGNAVPAGNQLVDNWGNAWDLQQRLASTYADANSMCNSLGGRLPLASEVYAVNASQALTTPIGDTSATDYIWTQTAGSTTDNHLTIRVSDGTTDTAVDTDSSAYRCVWPSTKGNILSGRSCYGDCFTVDDIIADSHDRPAMPVSSAVEECNAAGGRLPDFREMQTLIHQGWENGSDEFLWISESLYWYNANYGYPLGRWTGTGTSAWSYTNPVFASLSQGNNPHPFRCIYSSKVR